MTLSVTVTDAGGQRAVCIFEGIAAREAKNPPCTRLNPLPR